LPQGFSGGNNNAGLVVNSRWPASHFAEICSVVAPDWGCLGRSRQISAPHRGTILALI
jgi:hypothetical protein